MAFLFSFIFILAAFIFLAGIAFKSWHHARQQQLLLKNKITELTHAQKIQEGLKQELSKTQTQLHNARQDPVVQLPAWAFFEDRIKHSIHESMRYQFTMAILYIDLNNFKLINQALGYAVGDAVLNEVAARLQECIRQVDSIARFSKDVFVVLLTQLGKPEMAAIAAQRILESLAQPVKVNEHQLYITACIGISIYPSDGLDAAALFRSADQALIAAKKKGYQNYQFYQESIHGNSLRELALSTGLKSESLLNELEIYYQPIMDAQTKTIFCMQAFLCWRHPEIGFIQADELFYYAGQQNKLDDLCEFLLKQACQQFLSWHGLGSQPQLLSIPFSVKQLAHTQCIYRISQLLQEYNFRPECLLLEIKNNAAQLSFDVAEKALNMLQYLNIKLAVNDFGANGFSIQDLKKIKANYVKLASVLINDLAQHQPTKELVKAMKLLAESLSAQLIIQGVDSEQQMKVLSELGCYLVQGDFIGMPTTTVKTPTIML